MKNTLEFFEKRAIFDTISFSLKFVTQNFTHLFKSAVIVYAPLYLFLGALYFIDEQWFAIVTGGGYMGLMQMVRSEVYDNAQFTLPAHYWVISLAYQVLVGAFISAVFYNHFALYSKKGTDFERNDLTKEMGKSLWALMSVNAIITIVSFIAVFFFTRIIMLSFLTGSILGSFLIISATVCLIIYFFVRLIFLQILAVTEELNLIASLERSTELVKGNWWSIFGVIVVNSVMIGVVLIVIVAIPAYFIAVNMSRSTESMQIYQATMAVLGYILQFLIMMYWKTNLFAMYGSIVENKEGKNLHSKATALGKKEIEEDNEDF